MTILNESYTYKIYFLVAMLCGVVLAMVLGYMPQTAQAGLTEYNFGEANCDSGVYSFTIGGYTIQGCVESVEYYDKTNKDIEEHLEFYAEKAISKGYIGGVAESSGCVNALYFNISLTEYTHYWCGQVGQVCDGSGWGACTGYDPVTGEGGTQTRTVIPYTNSTGPSDSTPTSSQSCSVTLYTHWDTSAWGGCGGYDPATGQGGTQTRTVTSYTDPTCCDDSEPASSRTCDLPPDYDLYDVSGGNPNDITNTFGIYVTFINDQQIKFSSTAQIGVSPVFSSHPSQPTVTFSVIGVSPALPAGTEYFFTPSGLTTNDYSLGTEFKVKVPRTDPGLYKITIQAEGGGIVKQGIVNLNVNVADPTFEEI